MRFVTLSTYILAALLFLGVSDAQAMGHIDGHHSHHQLKSDNNIASPFDQKAGKNLPHCALNNHNHGKYCPHKKNFPSIIDENIFSECGSHSPNSLPAKISSNLKEMIASPLEPANYTSTFWKIQVSSIVVQSNISDLTSPPPQFS